MHKGKQLIQISIQEKVRCVQVSYVYFNMKSFDRKYIVELFIKNLHESQSVLGEHLLMFFHVMKAPGILKLLEK